MHAGRRVRIVLTSAMVMSAIGLSAVPANALTINQDYDLGEVPGLPFEADVTLTNSVSLPVFGGVSVKVTSLSTTVEDPSDVFELDGSACVGQTIAYGDSCDVHVKVIPSGLGTHYAHVLVAADVAGVPVSQLVDFDIRVRFDLVAPDIDLGTSDLGDVEIGVAQDIAPTFTNTFADTLTLSGLSVTVGGADSADVTSTDMSDCETTLAIDESCTPHASFTPSHLGAQEATFTVTGEINGVASTLRFKAVANAVPRLMEVAPASIDFGSVQAGQASAPRTVTLTNTSGVPATAVSVSLTGGSAGEFTLGDDTCGGAALAPDAFCSVDVAFSPTVHGTQTATLRFSTDVARNLTIDVPLTAFGTAPTVSLSAAGLTFPKTPNGETSPAKVVTIRNTGDGSLHVSGFVLTGEDPGSFEVTDDTCIGVAVSPGGRCAVAVAFAPTAIGAAQASVTIEDDTLGAPEAIALAGTGSPAADLRLTLKAAPSPVAAGGALTYTVKVINLGPNAASGVRVVQTLPVGSGFVSVAGGTCAMPELGDDGVVSCGLGKVASGASATLTIVVDAPLRSSGSTFGSVASVRATTFDPVLENNRVRRVTHIA